LGKIPVTKNPELIFYSVSCDVETLVDNSK